MEKVKDYIIGAIVILAIGWWLTYLVKHIDSPTDEPDVADYEQARADWLAARDKALNVSH